MTLRATVTALPRTHQLGPTTDDSKVRVFPDSTFDRVLYAQATAEVWMQPGIPKPSSTSGQAAAYKDPVGHQGVALVIGAGNVGSLGPRDVLTKLFVEGKVVVLKSNPVNDYLVPHWTKAFRPLIDAGVLAIVTGGAEVGVVPDASRPNR